VLWQREGHNWTATDLGDLGGTEWNLAFGINKRGQVVGQSGLPGNMAFHAFLWSEGMMTDLGTLPGDFVSWAETINNSGQAVGASFDASGNARAIVWEDGAITDLNTLIPPGSPWLLWEALGNNDRGQIVGPALNTINGEFQGYLLTPCDEKHPGDEGCDYSLAEALPTSSSSALSTPSVSVAPAIKPMMPPSSSRSFGLRRPIMQATPSPQSETGKPSAFALPDEQLTVGTENANPEVIRRERCEVSSRVSRAE
jgi:probable HAF family extracellular repeat protein